VLQDHQGRCLDHRMATQTVDAHITAEPCGFDQTQSWTLNGGKLRNRQGFCLSAFTGRLGSSLVLRECANFVHTWQLTSTGQLRFDLLCVETNQSNQVYLGPCRQESGWTKR
jgi:hypothetical protein